MPKLRRAKLAADGYWLLLPVQLAAWLADQSLRIQGECERGLAGATSSKPDGDDSKSRVVEAFFHIERIIGLMPYTSKEQGEFADSVSLAWRSAGRLFRHHARQARIAEWCFRKMNDHCSKVTTSVDLITDRWLGCFLLSICEPGKSTGTVVEARQLLQRHRDWSIESGILHWRTPAHLRLYLLSLVENASDDEAYLRKTASKRKAILDLAETHGETDSHRQQTRLFQALENILCPDSKVDTVRLLREALPAIDSYDPPSVLRAGRQEIAAVLLRRCPRLVSFVKHHLLDGESVQEIGNVARSS